VAAREKLKIIDGLKSRLDALRPLPPPAAARLREYYLVEWTHHSTALEGNTLNLRETKVVLEGITVGGKSLKEHLEIIDHRDAIDYLEDYLAQKRPLTEVFIRDLHRLVTKNTLPPKESGAYREVEVAISGTRYKPPPHFAVNHLVKEMVDEYNSLAKVMHPVDRAAWLHLKFVTIHPFIDGNGRTGRLLLNFSLMKDGYPPAIIERGMRDRYLEAIEAYQADNSVEMFSDLVADCVEISLKVHLASAKDK
jgi:Fic family protein